MTVVMTTTTRPAARATEEPATPPTTTRPADTDEATDPDSHASPRNFRGSWPHGWKHAGNVTALAIDLSKVNKKTLEKLVDSTLKHLGGKLMTINVQGEHVAELQTNLCGHITVALTKEPSRSATFKDMGCRVYFRGARRNQRDIEEVISWMGEMKELTRS